MWCASRCRTEWTDRPITGNSDDDGTAAAAATIMVMNLSLLSPIISVLGLTTDGEKLAKERRNSSFFSLPRRRSTCSGRRDGADWSCAPPWRTSSASNQLTAESADCLMRCCSTTGRGGGVGGGDRGDCCCCCCLYCCCCCAVAVRRE